MKTATNLILSASKGILIPFATSNFKLVAFFVVFFALLLIPATKIFATDCNGTYYTDSLKWYYAPVPEYSYRELCFNEGDINNANTDLIIENYLTGFLYLKTDNSKQFEITYQPPNPFLAFRLCHDPFYSDCDDWQTQTNYYLNDFPSIDFPIIYSTQSIKNAGGTIIYASNLPEGNAPIFDPDFPTDCVFSTTSTTTLNNFNATGTVRIPIDNVFHWFSFSVIAEDFNTAEKHYFSTSTDLNAPDIFNYSMPISLPEGSWKISYLLQGSYFESSFISTHYCEHTGIGTGLPLPTWTEITEAEFLGLEDCAEMPLLERLVCDLKNAIKRIFVPSPVSITALKTTIEALKNKAPMSYITITKNFFDDVKNGINNSQNLDFKILNKTGAVSFAFWDSTTDLAGQNQSFTQIFKTFFIFLIIFSFLIWAIFYIRKIFR